MHPTWAWKWNAATSHSIEIPDSPKQLHAAPQRLCSPVGEIHDLDTGEKYIVSKDGKAGPVTQKLYDTLNGIRLGEVDDTHGWNVVLDI